MKLSYSLQTIAITILLGLVMGCPVKEDYNTSTNQGKIYYLQFVLDKTSPVKGGEVQLCKKENGKEFILKRLPWEPCGGRPIPQTEGPIVSPDGEKRLFITEIPEGEQIILINERDEIINIDLGEFPETKELEEYGSSSPLWFPNSDKFIFLSGAPAGSGLYIYDLETSKVNCYLTDWFIYEPRWFDPGRSILFEKSNEGERKNNEPKRWDTMVFDLKTLKAKLLIQRER